MLAKIQLDIKKAGRFTSGPRSGSKENWQPLQELLQSVLWLTVHPRVIAYRPRCGSLLHQKNQDMSFLTK